ncbi:Rab geranylgeranyltransferase BET4 SCDLUD_004780 [Saccharomycodes ludwigii]|uniref:Rab geranylgeranyltransferase BET4 n=1 Tax=Saccharomycodes ludwigii TaxID=36035 RepID=UPI001E8B1FDB|nr:hypothetical protein SCDLUD_004780 [Saccharomycodes ludwigii]KAH3899341.1 hypothetical protein SCDLUD_004780 [Saccharomycodes ludwigii]
MIKQKKLKDQAKIKYYRELNNQLLIAYKTNHKYDLESFKLTSIVLDLNPELNVAWNFRRKIILNYFLQNTDSSVAFDWNQELNFTMLQLKRYPKVYWIWNHRTWCLRYVNDIQMWQNELHLVDKMLAVDARNFHGWTYRRYVVSQLKKNEPSNSDLLNETEFDYTTVKINKDISNFSAWHQRASLFPGKLSQLQGYSAKLELIKNEISYLTNAIFTDAEDQSVWIYLKWFITDATIVGILQTGEGGDGYLNVLKQFEDSIQIINNDEIEFSGKDNNWCLKILIVIQTIFFDKLQVEKGGRTDDRRIMLEKLVEVDPLRKNRYLYLLK